jgi:mono/diheme cytochrome c family protein
MIRSLPFVAMIAVVLGACSPSVPETRGANLYGKHCAACHGKSANGDGPLAAEIGLMPANLTLLSQRNGGVFPSEDVMAQIYGYPGRHQFGGMPEFGRNLSGPIVDWVSESGEIIATPQALIDLKTYLEGIQQER